jgi:hypothetical protein
MGPEVSEMKDIRSSQYLCASKCLKDGGAAISGITG